MEKKSAYSMEAFPDLNQRGAFSIYCDDLRQEASGKSIIVGVYSGELHVQEFPALLPTFHILTTVWTNRGRPFKKLVFRILLDETVLSEEEVDIAAAQEKMHGATKDEPGKNHPNSRQIFRRIARFSPFVLEKECVLRVRVETEEGELRTSALGIRVAPREEVASGEAPDPGAA